MTPSTLLIRGGTVVNASGRCEASVLVENGLVAALLEPDAEASTADQVVDATGMLVLPGGVDPHCHVGQRLGDISMLDTYELASTAALWGGTTTIIDFAIPEPGQTPLDAMAQLGVLPVKLFTTYRGGVMANLDTITEVMRVNERNGGLTLIHAEHNSWNIGTARASEGSMKVARMMAKITLRGAAAGRRHKTSLGIELARFERAELLRRGRKTRAQLPR